MMMSAVCCHAQGDGPGTSTRESGGEKRRGAKKRDEKRREGLEGGEEEDSGHGAAPAGRTAFHASCLPACLPACLPEEMQYK